ncbi:hypothetical protein MBANPS3_005811, partial [Mucor bainieri]
MTTGSSLPLEIFLRIFDYVDSVKGLAQCRLSCKRWDRLAEYAMFGKQLTITYANSLSFYHQLQKKPANAQRIKHLCFDIVDCTDVIVEILRLAVTPSIERIEGTIRYLDDLFYKELIAIGTVTKLTNLRAIPYPYIYSEIHTESLLLFKDTLQELHHGFGDFYFMPPDIFEKLDEFKCLKKLSTHCVFDSIAELDAILDGAHQLQELEIHREVGAGDLWLEDDVQSWLHDNVQVVPSLTKVRFCHDKDESWLDDEYIYGISPWLMEYLFFKYPNIDYLGTNAAEEYWVDELDNLVEVPPYRLCSAIYKLPSHDIQVFFERAWDSQYDPLVGDINIVKLAYYESEFVLHCRHVKSQMDQQRGDEATGERTTEFQLAIGQLCVKELYKGASSFGLIQEMATTFMTAIKIDLSSDYGYRNSPGDPLLILSESALFFKTVQVISSQQTMQMAVRKLQAVPEVIVIKADKSQLNELEICYAEIDSKVLSTLTRLFSAINVLTFTCCLIGKDEEIAACKSNTSMSCIHLPSTKLRQLVISYKVHTDIGDIDYATQMKQKTRMNRTTYILLSMDHELSLAFKLCYASGKATPVSFREYNVVAATRLELVMHIICQSLEVIVVCLDHASFNIYVSKYMNSAFAV